MTRFAIHLETGVVVAITPETKGNYLYQEIKPKVAIAIRDGKVTPEWVIEQILAKMPRTTLREKVKLEGSLNVRSIDFGLREAARASADLGDDRSIDIELPDEKKGDQPKNKGSKKNGKKATQKEEPGGDGEVVDIELPGGADGDEGDGEQPPEGEAGGDNGESGEVVV